jgi:hypothetical protein
VIYIVISVAGCFVLMHVLLIINVCHFIMMQIPGCNVKVLTRQEISHILWKLRVHYHVHMSPTLSQMKFK